MDVSYEEINTVIALILVGYGLKLKARKNIKKRKRKIWIKDWLSKRHEKGHFNNIIIQELRL